VSIHPKRALDAVAISVLIVATLGFVSATDGSDARGLYDVSLTAPYSGYRPSLPGFPYSPLVAQLLQPFHALPWPVFHGLIVGGELAALAWLIGLPLAALLAVVQPPLLVDELRFANIQLMVTVLVVVGQNRPAAWTVPLLTKVSPGVGLIWFVVRREWRQLSVAVGFTALLALVSFVVAPDLWGQWLGLLTGSPLRDAGHLAPLPFILRIAIASAVVAVAGLSGRVWLVPIGAAIAAPEYGAQWLLVLGSVRLVRDHGWGRGDAASDAGSSSNKTSR
jgi:hypothetical protein